MSNWNCVPAIQWCHAFVVDCSISKGVGINSIHIHIKRFHAESFSPSNFVFLGIFFHFFELRNMQKCFHVRNTCTFWKEWNWKNTYTIKTIYLKQYNVVELTLSRHNFGTMIYQLISSFWFCCGNLQQPTNRFLCLKKVMWFGFLIRTHQMCSFHVSITVIASSSAG